MTGLESLAAIAPADSAPSRARRRGGQRTGEGLQRATIPPALVLAVVFPVLGAGWFLLPGDAPLKIGAPVLAVALIAVGLICGVMAGAMMRQVAQRHRVERRRH